MNRFHLLTALCLLLTTTAFSQLKFSLQPMASASTYGVYVKPCGGIVPTANTITGTGQVTIVVPLGNNITEIVSYGGAWSESASVSAPSEAPDKNIFSYGFLTDSPQIVYEAGKQTLLFSFVMEGPGEPRLLDNENDAFAQLPNSVNTNPGNEISVLDIGSTPVGYYYYTGNFSPDDPDSCSEEDPTTPALEVLNHENLFTLSPNPTSHRLQIEFLNEKINANGKIRLWTAQGIALQDEDWEGHPSVSLDVNKLPVGVYFLSFEKEGKVLQRERFVKL